MANREDLAALASEMSKEQPGTGAQKTGWLKLWAFFIVRRGTFYFENLGWAADDPQLRPRLVQEIGKVETFLGAELGDADDPGNLAERMPSHLDLEEVVRTRDKLTAAAVKPLVTKAEDVRRLFVAKIGVRALAAHSDLWDQGQIHQGATREIIDRRLRLVEQMNYHVNTPGGGRRTWELPGAEDLQDGFITRLFEYPSLVENLGGLEAAQDGGFSLNATDGTGEAPYQQTDADDWDWLRIIEDNKLVEYRWDRPPPFPEDIDPNDPPNVLNNQAIVNARLPTALLRRSWKVSPTDMHALRFFGGTPTTSTLGEAVDALLANDTGAIAAKANFWNRAWLFCDHVISALHIEALLFARRRRVGKAAADAEINALASRPTGPNPEHSRFVWLGALVPKESTSVSVSTGLLDGRAGNTFFLTRLGPLDDLEIGDQIVFWNSAIYDVLTGGELRLENAAIVDLATNADGSLDLGQLWLAGHGMLDSLSGYRTRFMDTTNALLASARKLIRQRLVPPNQNAIEVRLATGHKVIRWAPYTGLAAGNTVGPWWLVYPLHTIPDSPFLPMARTVDEAVIKIPGTIGVEVSGGGAMEVVTASIPKAGSTEMPEVRRLDMAPPGGPTASAFTPFSVVHPSLSPSGHVLFPLVRPEIGVQSDAEAELAMWPRYLLRRAGAQFSPKLKDLTVDGSVIPGIIVGNRQVWSTSPKPRPS